MMRLRQTVSLGLGLVTASIVAIGVAGGDRADNPLRNGSFEGSLPGRATRSSARDRRHPNR